VSDQLDDTLGAYEGLAGLLHHRRDLFAPKQAGALVIQDPDLHRSAYSTIHQRSFEHEERRGGDRPMPSDAAGRAQ
jgi:hypothetical protein